MVKVEEKGRPKYSKFDKMDTDVLEAVLRADFDAPEAERMDLEAVIYISNLLAERRETPNSKLADAKADFYEYYYPLTSDEKSLYDFDDDTNDADAKTTTIENTSQSNMTNNMLLNGWRKFASAAAVFVLIMFGGTLTAYALGYDPIAVIGGWNDDCFWFESASVTAELTDAVDDYADGVDLVPQWLPEGYVFDAIETSGNPSYNSIGADFYREWNNRPEKISIDYRFSVMDNSTPLYEKDNSNVTEYPMYGTIYYIMENLDNEVIVWRNGSFDCFIMGNFSLTEAKKIIDSIYGE